MTPRKHNAKLFQHNLCHNLAISCNANKKSFHKISTNSCLKLICLVWCKLIGKCWWWMVYMKRRESVFHSLSYLSTISGRNSTKMSSYSDLIDMKNSSMSWMLCSWNRILSSLLIYCWNSLVYQNCIETIALLRGF